MGRYEQPDYIVISRGADYEIRHYSSYLVAETSVSGGFDDTGSAAFRRLAGFIFGRNSAAKKMNMTVPVTHIDDGAGSHRYRFVMERQYDESSVPEPLDASVAVQRVAAGHYGAVRYKGNRRERRFRKVEAKLMEALERDGIETMGPAASAVYDGPWVPSLLRRNEVLVPISWPL